MNNMEELKQWVEKHKTQLIAYPWVYVPKLIAKITKLQSRPCKGGEGESCNKNNNCTYPECKERPMPKTNRENPN